MCVYVGVCGCVPRKVAMSVRMCACVHVGVPEWVGVDHVHMWVCAGMYSAGTCIVVAFSPSEAAGSRPM